LYRGRSGRWWRVHSRGRAIDQLDIQEQRELVAGGGVSVLGDNKGNAFVSTSNCAFVNNTANTGGGMQYSSSDGIITNTVFLNNNAGSQGGGIFADTSVIDVISSHFSGNSQNGVLPGHALTCGAGGVITLNGATDFCGSNGNNISCSNISPQPLVNTLDQCSVCNGGGLYSDCASVCFTGAVVQLGGCGTCISLEQAAASTGEPVIPPPPTDNNAVIIGAAVGGGGGFLIIVGVTVGILVRVFRKRP